MGQVIKVVTTVQVTRYVPIEPDYEMSAEGTAKHLREQDVRDVIESFIEQIDRTQPSNIHKIKDYQDNFYELEEPGTCIVRRKAKVLEGWNNNA